MIAPHHRVTLLTLTSFLLGLSSLYLPVTLTILLTALLIGVPYFIFITFQSPKDIATYTLTTYGFGIIWALAIPSINSNFNAQTFNKCFYESCPDGVSFPKAYLYLMIMTIYHYFQFQLNNCFHHNKLEWKCFLIYHSPQYTAMNILILSEYFTLRTGYLLRFSLFSWQLYCILPIIAILSLSIRVCAFFTAQSNFTHIVAYEKRPSHRLVKHGIYSFLRHPSYTGYFYYTVSMQLLLGNLLTTLLSLGALIVFFNERIKDQQQQLSDFFPNQYPNYALTTYISIPFVQGIYKKVSSVPNTKLYNSPKITLVPPKNQ